MQNYNTWLDVYLIFYIQHAKNPCYGTCPYILDHVYMVNNVTVNKFSSKHATSILTGRALPNIKTETVRRLNYFHWNKWSNGQFLTTSIIQRIMRHQSFALFHWPHQNSFNLSGKKISINLVTKLLTILLKETITDKMFLTKKQFLVMFLTFFFQNS